MENPYQSPQTDSMPEASSAPPIEDAVLHKNPTWRFWVLIVLGAPAVVLIALLLSAVVSQWLNSSRNNLRVLILLWVGVAVLYAGCCALIKIYWHAPAERTSVPGAGQRTAYFIAALWGLALLAAPTAFFGTCTPATLLIVLVGGPSRGGEGGAFLLGFMIGVIGLVLLGVLAHGLWLDAVGRKPPSPQEAANLGRVRDRHPFQDGGK